MYDKDAELTQAMDRLYEALMRLDPDSPEWEALEPEYEQAYRAWDEYHQTECPICRRTEQRLRAWAASRAQGG